MTFIYDLINLEFVLLVFLFVLIYLRLDLLRSTIILLHLVTIFLLNDVLFHPSYMPDQFRYLAATQHFRNTFELASIGRIENLSGALFALIPLPFINSVQSIAMINFVLYLSVFVFLRKKKVSNNAVDFFFLLYPSLMLYTSLALRETLVLFFMMISLYTIIVKDRTVVGLIIAVPLAFLKIQNFLMILLALSIFKVLSGRLNLRKLIIIALIPMAYMYLQDLRISYFTLGQYFSLEKMEMYRNYMYYENTGDYRLGYEPIGGWANLPFISVKSLFYFLLRPLPWQATNILQLVQSLENLFMVALLVLVNLKKTYSKSVKRKRLFLNIFLLVSMTVYGLMVFNYGAAARYRFVLLAVYFVFNFYLLGYDKLLYRNTVLRVRNNMGALSVGAASL